MSLIQRSAHLREHLASFDSLAIAFSGGVDSSVLLHAAHSVLGARAVGVIADSGSLPRADLAEAQLVARDIGIELKVLKTEELNVEGYRENQGLRCYWCRHTLFSGMQRWAQQNGFSAMAYGEITDDLLDTRPGRQAANEFGVLAPLVMAGLNKEDVRRYASLHGLRVAHKPASACLASRLPKGTPVTAAGLLRIERAEAGVRALGFRVLRVRDYGTQARLEVGETELERARAQRPRLATLLAEFGFEDFELAAYASPASAASPG